MSILLQVASEHFESSKKITAPLVIIMILQEDILSDGIYVKTLKIEEKRKCEEKLKIKAVTIEKFLSPSEIQAISDAKDPGASNWLSAVTLGKYNFALNKKGFCDAKKLRYGKDLKGIHLV